MDLGEFLYNLHFHTEKTAPDGWEPDWEDAPLPYKLYRGLPAIPLSNEVPLTLAKWKEPAVPSLTRIGHFLWYTYGLTQITQSGSAEETVQSLRRFVPSGGGLYPNELYLYLNVDEAPSGIYHYDAARHQLVLLREGNWETYLSEALGERCDISSCFGAVLISAKFWKNFFKYNQFSYRLQGLDAGVLAGQLQEAAKRFGFSCGVYVQFLDRALNHILGLNDKEESVYAVIPLSVEPMRWFAGTDRGLVSAEELCRSIPPIITESYERSKRILDYSLLCEINEASFMESAKEFRKIGSWKKPVRDGQETNLGGSRFLYDLASSCRSRFSPDMDFMIGDIHAETAGDLLREAVSASVCRNDLDGAEINRSRLSVYACFYHVEGIEDGAYLYEEGTLKCIRPGDHRLYLQDGLTLHNVNLYTTPIVLHVAGDRGHLMDQLSWRGYRVQQMEAGMLVQRLLLAASALGLGGHPLLGYDVSRCDRLYKLEETGETCLIQIPIGGYRERAWLKGGLHG
ncbi:SagB family peptide dehydrogenase [Metabacillus sp. 84]|uniref:SagB family peptide dehydrogenase n=1 Tax=Metabacillus sp. 84 TaxID=3404705 RepID=UPI003CFB3632